MPLHSGRPVSIRDTGGNPNPVRRGLPRSSWSGLFDGLGGYPRRLGAQPNSELRYVLMGADLRPGDAQEDPHLAQRPTLG